MYLRGDGVGLRPRDVADRPDDPADGRGTSHPLDNPVYASLTGAHAHLARTQGRVLRYAPDVAPFFAPPAEPDSRYWAELAAVVGPGGTVMFGGVEVVPPAGWQVQVRIGGVQMVGTSVVPAADPQARPLGPDDVPEMLDLVARTRPGPFLPRTIELGAYLGIHRDGRLVAMAGQRMHPPGWTEISAVCTDQDHRGQGLAGRLIRAVAAGIRERGETPFLHAAASNTGAIRLYQALGFTLRREVLFVLLQAPTTDAAPALPSDRRPSRSG